MAADYDAIIVGGGFAGVTTARELKLKGLRCLLLEARDRLGGRTFSTEFQGHQVEFGGTWIHWTQPHVWAELKRYGLEIVESPRPENVVWLSRGRRTAGGAQMLAGLLGSIDRVLTDARRFKRPYEARWYEGCEDLDLANLQQRINRTEDLALEEIDFVTTMLGSLCSSSCDDAGLLKLLHWYALANCNTPLFLDTLARYKFRDGTKSLIDAMVADAAAELRLSTPVAKVTHDAPLASVTTQAGDSFTARAVVIALPVNVLADLEFRPALMAGKLAYSRERHAGHGIKSWSLVSGAPKNLLAIGQGPGLTWMQSEYQVPEGSLMVGFGPDPQVLDVTDVGSVERTVRTFAPEARVLAAGGHDWFTDPYSKGVWCVPKPNQTTRYLGQLQQREGRLIFAGSDTATAWSGFIDGAIESGLRAAREVCEVVGS